MTGAEMRNAKAELHKTIIDTIIKCNPTDEEMDELLTYVENLAKSEKSIDK